MESESRRAGRRRYYIKAKADGRLKYLRDPERRKKLYEASKRRWAEVRLEFISEYGGKCACCSETHIEFLTMDHGGSDIGFSYEVGACKNGEPMRRNIRGTAEYFRLKKLGWPKNSGFRILCMNCNFAIRGGRKCPHENGVVGSTYSMQLGPSVTLNGPPSPPLTHGNKLFMASLTQEQRNAWAKRARDARKTPAVKGPNGKFASART